MYGIGERVWHWGKGCGVGVIVFIFFAFLKTIADIQSTKNTAGKSSLQF